MGKEIDSRFSPKPRIYIIRAFGDFWLMLIESLNQITDAATSYLIVTVLYMQYRRVSLSAVRMPIPGISSI